MTIYSGVRNEAWDYCDICGGRFYVGELTVQKGAKKCPKDVDDLDIELRQLMIAEVLSQGDEFSDESAETLQYTPGDTPTF